MLNKTHIQTKISLAKWLFQTDLISWRYFRVTYARYYACGCQNTNDEPFNLYRFSHHSKNLEYFENFDNFEVCLSSEITLRKNYLQHEVRVKTVHRSKLPKMLKKYCIICIIQSVMIIYYNIFLRRFYLTGAFLRHYNRIITHNLPWRSTPVKIPSV